MCAMEWGATFGHFWYGSSSPLIMVPWKFGNTHCKVFGPLIQLYMCKQKSSTHQQYISKFKQPRSQIIQPP